MGLNPLLRSIPTGIKIAKNPAVWGHFVAHTWVLNAVAGASFIWLALIPISYFPLTFGGKRSSYMCVPDLGSGDIYTLKKVGTRYLDNY